MTRLAPCPRPLRGSGSVWVCKRGWASRRRPPGGASRLASTSAGVKRAVAVLASEWAFTGARCGNTTRACLGATEADLLGGRWKPFCLSPGGSGRDRGRGPARGREGRAARSPGRDTGSSVGGRSRQGSQMENFRAYSAAARPHLYSARPSPHPVCDPRAQGRRPLLRLLRPLRPLPLRLRGSPWRDGEASAPSQTAADSWWGHICPRLGWTLVSLPPPCSSRPVRHGSAPPPTRSFQRIQ